MELINRPRRLRQNDSIRRLCRETRLSPDSLIYPIFVDETLKGKRPIESLPGQCHYGLDSLDQAVADCKALASTLRRDLIRPLCIFNFGEDKRIPKLRFDCEESEDLTQTATIIGTLVNEIGLRVPTSFIYKKFSIPEPEADEEIAAPRPGAGLGALPFKAGHGTALALKAGDGGEHGTQEQIDRLTSAAIRKSAGTFKRAFAPVIRLVEQAESLEELRALMEDDKSVAALYRDMDISAVEALLQKVMTYADLEGRVTEDG